MAARKLQIEIDKTFKKVDEGIQEFEGIYEKIHQSTNQSQKEKLEDSLKKEIKKLQRHRDQIKTWAASNDIKDKKPLVDKRKLIETEMEKFKAVEKEMKTKAYSKEGLMAGGKLDPKEKEKAETGDFLSSMVEELERQVEQIEAEMDKLGASMKKGKKDTSKAERLSVMEERRERHKWHQGKLEMILRTLENGGIDADLVKAKEEDIRYYVENNEEADFMEDDEIYDELHLEEDDDAFGAGNDMDKVSSQDTQSVAEDTEHERPVAPPVKQKPPPPEPSTASARRPSMHTKSPLPALATLHAPMPSPQNGVASTNMKPAPPPVRTPGEPLKYASAAAAAAASDKNGIGIGPLPPPPNVPAAPLSTLSTSRPGSAASPSIVSAQPITTQPLRQGSLTSKSPAPASIPSPPVAPSEDARVASPAVVEDRSVSSRLTEERPKSTRPASVAPEEAAQASTPSLTNGDTHSEVEEEESIFHLPASLSDLLESFNATRASAFDPAQAAQNSRLFAASALSVPDNADAERPSHYRPMNPFNFTPNHYPQEPLNMFDDPRVYSRLDTDTLFYLFYYQQGTYSQFLAARALKTQSWRFHKQYSTWFQRHEEPKKITEEFEQGTYRFFDYESTWMNRRKADFKFLYKFLEDDV